MTIMEPTTVIGFVNALTQTYADAANLYSRWKRARTHQNHYRRPGAAQRTIPTCALSTSLDVAGTQIRETYDIAFAIVGTEFSTGDSACREGLRAQLHAITARVASLRAAAAAASRRGPLDLADVLQTSEAARVAAVHELTELYLRFAASRPIPRELPVPKPRSRQDGEARFDGGYHSRQTYLQSNAYDEDDRLTTAMTISSGPLRFQSEPPSPPPTPKVMPDDVESTWGGGAPSEAGPGVFLRPKNSVFSIFCPEAMTLQVNLQKTVPDARRCKCGYRWRPATTTLAPDSQQRREDAILLKEGFRMTGRFLAKSHCDREGYGCVLCTSTGRTDTYDSAEALRVHINATHTKWQMLHDRDMT